MKLEQDEQALSLSKRGKQSEQLTFVDTNDFDELKSRGLNLRPIWRIIQRNASLITGLTTVVALAALYSVLTTPRTYQGDFRLLVEPITSEAKFTDPSVLARNSGGSYTGAGLDYASLVDVDYPSLLQVLKSPKLLTMIAKRIQLRYPDVSYDLLSKNLVVQRVGTNLIDFTNVIKVSYKEEDPAKVQFVLTEVTKGYLKYSLENRRTRVGEGVQFIQGQIPGLQQRVDNLRGQLQTFQQRYNLIDPTTESEELSRQISGIRAQKIEAQRQLSENKALYINLQKQLSLSPDQVIAASTLTENPNYQNLLAQLKKVESLIAVESARFSEESPIIQTLRQKQKNLSLLVNQEAQQILGSTGNSKLLTFQNSTRLALIKQLANTANQVKVLEIRNQQAAQAEALLEKRIQQLAATTRQYNDVKERLDITTKALEQLLMQRENLRVEAAQNQVPWEVIAEPRIASNAAGNLIPVSRGTTKKLAIGLVGGFLLGLGAAVLRDKYRNVFHTTEDIQDAITLPVLGVISFNKSAKMSKSSAVVESIAETESYYSGTSLFLETFNSLYTSIRFFSEPPVRSLVVSSAAPGDGKTTIALNLAQAAAAMGQKVLLVDANLRLPQLHIKLGLSNQKGLSNLYQNPDSEECIQRSPLQENLFVLTSGKLLPNSTKLLASSQMQNLMEQFQTAFDLVIYDASHLLGLADTNFLAANTDGILMVVGLGKTNLSEMMHVLNGLDSFRLPILGIVANHFKGGENSSYGYHNRYYEQNHQVRPSFAKKPQKFKTDLLALAKQTDDALE